MMFQLNLFSKLFSTQFPLLFHQLEKKQRRFETRDGKKAVNELQFTHIIQTKPNLFTAMFTFQMHTFWMRVCEFLHNILCQMNWILFLYKMFLHPKQRCAKTVPAKCVLYFFQKKLIFRLTWFNSHSMIKTFNGIRAHFGCQIDIFKVKKKTHNEISKHHYLIVADIMINNDLSNAIWDIRVTRKKTHTEKYDEQIWIWACKPYLRTDFKHEY